MHDFNSFVNCTYVWWRHSKCLKTLITSTYQTTGSMLLWTAFVRKLGATLHNTRLAIVTCQQCPDKVNWPAKLGPKPPLYLMLASLCMSLIYPRTMISLIPSKLPILPLLLSSYILFPIVVLVIRKKYHIKNLCGQFDWLRKIHNGSQNFVTTRKICVWPILGHVDCFDRFIPSYFLAIGLIGCGCGSLAYIIAHINLWLCFF